MRFTPSSSVQTRRIQRLYRWMRLWVLWWLPAVAAWFVLAGRADARKLDRVARGVLDIVFLQAVLRARRPACAVRHGPARRGWRHVRDMLGARLRRAVNARDFATRVFRIAAFVRDAEKHIARLVRRLESGFRRCGEKACAHAFPACATLAPMPAHARFDSS